MINYVWSIFESLLYLFRFVVRDSELADGDKHGNELLRNVLRDQTIRDFHRVANAFRIPVGSNALADIVGSSGSADQIFTRAQPG